MFRVEFIGNIGADCERKTDNGRSFYTIKVAHSDRYTDANGKEHETTVWASCILNEKVGDAVAQYLTKGRKVFLRGRASLNVYSSKIDRCMKAGIQVSVDELELIGGQTDEVPRQLVDPNTNRVIDTCKTYYVDSALFVPEGHKNPVFPEFFIDTKGFKYTCQNGFVAPERPVEQPADAETTEVCEH